MDKTKIRNSWIMFCNKVWFWWQKIRYRLPDWDDIKDFFIAAFCGLLGLFAVTCIVVLILTIIFSFEKKKDVEENPKNVVVKCNGVEFRKCVLEGHEYWFAYVGYKGGLVHSESCPCHTNKVEVVQ